MKNELKNKYGSWCLVAGAAEGLGRTFSQALAQRGMNVIMVDRQKDRLDSMARQMES
jgi:short-subunit dehydrogenase